MIWNHRIRTIFIRTIKNKLFQQRPMIEMELIRIEFTTMIIITIEITLKIGQKMTQNARDLIFCLFISRFNKSLINNFVVF